MPEVTLYTARTEDRIVMMSNSTRLKISANLGFKVKELNQNDVQS